MSARARRQAIHATCGRAVPSWNQLRSHELYCAQCKRIERRKQDRAVAIMERMETLAHTVKWQAKGELGEAAIYSVEARAYRRYLRLLWKLPTWSAAASGAAADLGESIHSVPQVRKVYAHRESTCLVCGQPAFAGRSETIQVPRLGKFTGCEHHMQQAQDAAMEALRAKYPQTEWTAYHAAR
jgi:hypothetical protein